MDTDSCGQRLSLYLFSTFEARNNGQPINEGLTGKTRQLLKILGAHSRRPLSREALIEIMWPVADPQSAATSLKVTAHKLRCALDPERSGHNWIFIEKGTYRLNALEPIWIDAEVFRSHYDQGRAFESGGRHGEAMESYAKAESLYLGDYLEEDMYEDWTVIRREELRDVYLDTLQRLACLSFNRDAHTDVIQYCHKIVLADPCREDAYRMLMRAHASLHQVARAGAWYAVCRATLQREMMAAPSRETAEAFEQLFAPDSESRLFHNTA